MIPGGYYIKARRIQESAIANAPPHSREIWDWLLREANHRGRNSHGRLIQRGQCVRRYSDIIEGLSWYVGFRKESYTKWQCETAMKWLTKEQMVTTKKTTRGLIITICNYDYYQNPANYENHKERHNETTTEPQTTDTINKKDNQGRKERAAKPPNPPASPPDPAAGDLGLFPAEVGGDNPGAEKINTLAKFKARETELISRACKLYGAAAVRVKEKFDQFVEYCEIHGKKYARFDLAFFKAVREDWFERARHEEPAYAGPNI